MPFIISKVSQKISKDEERALKERLGKAIELVPGKSEEYLLLGFEDGCRLYLGGDDSAPLAYIQANIFGNEGHFGYDAFSREVAKIFHEVLKIPEERVYISYTDIPDWSVDGMNIDRNRYR